MKQLTIVGAGWAGLSAAVAATQTGWQVQLYEATSMAGGRARRLSQSIAGKALDNGQHILIGAYRDTLSLMRTVGLNPHTLLQRLPLDVRFANGQGLHLPDWPMPLNLLGGLTLAKGWTLQDKASLVQAAWHWQRKHFECDPTWTVAELCHATDLSDRVVQHLIEPLCLSALNTRTQEASAMVFLRVLRDALLGGVGSSDLLIPRVDLGALLPDACLQWLRDHGAKVHLGQRIEVHEVDALQRVSSPNAQVLLACAPWDAARLAANLAPSWAVQCTTLSHNAIATVYLRCTDTDFRGLSRPMLALHSHALAPAQFVFDRGMLNGQTGLLAAVVSACTSARDEMRVQVQAQVCEQLGLGHLEIVQTVIEKRATLACTPTLVKPEPYLTQGLWACGDYIRGPYPSTLEGAVRSGQQVVTQINQVVNGQGLG